MGALPRIMPGGALAGRGTHSPAGRAERLGLADVEPAASTALTMPFEFLRLGDNRKVSAQLAGRIGGLGARLFDFNADEFVSSRDGDGGVGLPCSRYPYHVAAIELGFQLPWLAIAARRVHAPSQRIYPGRRGDDLGTADRRTNRDYLLHADDLPAVAAVLDGPLREWLPDGLTARIQHRPVITIEISGNWAMTALQATGLAFPDDLELRMQDRPGHPGPWPEVLLGLLAAFRDRVPTAVRNTVG
jgi:hypothetical protein